MARLIIRRLIALIPLLLGMSFILFTLTYLLPADPVRAALGPDASLEQISAYREQLGLDDPLWKQYLTYLRNLAQGDFGTSIVSRRPVIDDLIRFFPATLELGLTSLVISVTVAIPLGVVSAVKRGRGIDRVSQVLSLTGVSMPVFWLGVLLQILFYAQLGWLPAADRLDNALTPPPTVTGMYTIDALLSGQFDVFINALKHLVLPAVALSNINIAILTRITRSSMLDVLAENYVTTARAKGLRARSVIYGHAFRNALVPIVTVAGLRFGDLLAGAILTETIFSWPGIGRYAVKSIANVDFPAIIGFALVAAVLYFLVNLAVDIFYTLADPRMR